MAYRTDGTANFNFFINRQGPRGPQGIQGPDGFSPNVQVEEDQGNTFTLKITNKEGYFVTSNLREHKEDRGGDYIRYDRNGELMYIGSPDFATTVKAGEVRLSTVDDLTAGSDTVALTPKVYKDDVTSRIAEVDNRILIAKTELNNEIAAETAKLQGNIDVTNLRIDNTNSKVDNLDKTTVKLTGNQTIQGDKTFNDYVTIQYLTTDEIFSKTGPRLILSDDSSTSIGDTRKKTVLFTQGNTIAINDDANTILTQNNVTAGNNTVITKTANGIKISSTAQGDVTLAGDNSFTGNNTFDGITTLNGDTWVDNLQVGTSLTNQQGKKFLDQSKIVAGDNITVEETTDGVKITSTGGGSSEPPANMVTTDTVQSITAYKVFEDSVTVRGKMNIFPNKLGVYAAINFKGVDSLSSSIGNNPKDLMYIQPILDSDRMIINNYADEGAPTGSAKNVIIYGNLISKNNNIASQVLHQSNVTAGDNITIENTTDGIKISSTASGGGAAIDDANISTTTVYSSDKTVQFVTASVSDAMTTLNQTIQELQARVQALEAMIDGGNAGSGGEPPQPEGPVDNPTLLVSLNTDETIHFKEGDYKRYNTTLKTYDTKHYTQRILDESSVVMNNSISVTNLLKQVKTSGAMPLYLQARGNDGLTIEAWVVTAPAYGANPDVDQFLGYLCWSEQYSKAYFSDKAE